MHAAFIGSIGGNVDIMVIAVIVVIAVPLKASGTDKSSPPSILAKCGFSIIIVYVLGNIGIEPAAYLIRFLIKDDDVNGHLVFEQEIAYRVDRNPQRPVLGIAVDAR